MQINIIIIYYTKEWTQCAKAVFPNASVVFWGSETPTIETMIFFDGSTTEVAWLAHNQQAKCGSCDGHGRVVDFSGSGR